MQRRFAEAEDAMRATLKLDAENAFALPNLAHLLLRRGATQEAVGVYRRVGRVGTEARPGFDPDHDALCLGLALRAAGEETEAVSVMQAAAGAMRARAGSKTMTALEEVSLAALLAGAGRSAEARARLARVEGSGEPKGETAAWLARAYATLGEAERAAILYEQAVRTGYDDPYYVLIDPSLAAIRDRPEIDRLVPAKAPTS
jgi:tetratricopeptide (TPR) repeat protein